MIKKEKISMKQSTTLLPLSLALLFSTSSAFSSATSELLAEEDTKIATVVVQPISDDIGSASASVLAEEEKFDPRDKNHDGKVSFGEKVHYFLDRDKDGDIEFDDVTHAAGEFFKKVKAIFDTDGDGQVEFDEIISGTQNALKHLGSLAGRVLELSGGIKDSSYFALIPENVKGPLSNLLAIVDEAAAKTQDGVNIGGGYVSKIEDALGKLKPQISGLFKGEASAEEMGEAKKDIFAYLEMIKGWYNTGDNTKLITSIEKRLAKA